MAAAEVAEVEVEVAEAEVVEVAAAVAVAEAAVAVVVVAEVAEAEVEVEVEVEVEEVAEVEVEAVVAWRWRGRRAKARAAMPVVLIWRGRVEPQSAFSIEVVWPVPNQLPTFLKARRSVTGRAGRPAPLAVRVEVEVRLHGDPERAGFGTNGRAEIDVEAPVVARVALSKALGDERPGQVARIVLKKRAFTDAAGPMPLK